MDKFAGGAALGGMPVSASVADALDSSVLGEVLLASDPESPSCPHHLLVRPDADWGGVCLELVSPEHHSLLEARAIARSQMHSMLSDNSRCERYARAIQSTITSEDTVLDIGAGTGLLSLLAAESGAKSVHAAEMFPALASLAKRVIKDNGYERSIFVHPLSSTGLTVQGNDDEQYCVAASLDQGDTAGHRELQNSENAPSRSHQHVDVLPRRATAVVSEILDSGLLGECVLPALKDARERLLLPKAKYIPARARLYAQVVTSPSFFSSFHYLPSFPFHRSKTSIDCKGGLSRTPYHISSLGKGVYTAVTDRFLAFEFKLDGTEDLERVQAGLSVKRIAPGAAHAVVTTWEIDLTENGDVKYSTAKDCDEQWQDHWLPVVHALPKYDDDESGDCIVLSYGHNATGVWFANGSSKSQRPCACGWHALRGGAPRLRALSDAADVNGSLAKRVREVIQSAMRKRRKDEEGEEHDDVLRVLDVGDGSIAGLHALRIAKSDDFLVHVASVEGDALAAILHAQAASALTNDRTGVAATKGLEVHATMGDALQWQYGIGQHAVRLDVVLTEYAASYAAAHSPPAALADIYCRFRAVRRNLKREEDGDDQVLFKAVPAVGELRARLVRFKQGNPCVRISGDVLGFDHSAMKEVDETLGNNEQFFLAMEMYPVHTSEWQKIAEMQFEKGQVWASNENFRLKWRHDKPLGPPHAVEVTAIYDECPQHSALPSLILPVRAAVRDACVDMRAVWNDESAEWMFQVEVP